VRGIAEFHPDVNVVWQAGFAVAVRVEDGQGQADACGDGPSAGLHPPEEARNGRIGSSRRRDIEEIHLIRSPRRHPRKIPDDAGELDIVT
jgi:hypothetical protein